MDRNRVPCFGLEIPRLKKQRRASEPMLCRYLPIRCVPSADTGGKESVVRTLSAGWSTVAGTLYGGRVSIVATGDRHSIWAILCNKAIC